MATFSYSSAYMQSFDHANPSFVAVNNFDDPSSRTNFGLPNGNSTGVHHNVALAPNYPVTSGGSKHVISPGICGFQKKVDDERHISPLYISALEHYLNDMATPAPRGVRCLMSGCQMPFPTAQAMLQHLKDCPEFSAGSYECPECHGTEKCRTTLQRRGSSFRLRFGNKASQLLHAFPNMIKRLTSARSGMCVRCRVTLKEEYNRTIRHCNSSPSVSQSASEYMAPPTLHADKRAHSDPDCGKCFSTNQCSSYSVYSPNEPSELLGSPGEPLGEPLHELFGSPGDSSSSLTAELFGSSPANELDNCEVDPFAMEIENVRVQSASGVSQPFVFDNFEPHAEVSSVGSAESYQPDLSPFTTGISPNTAVPDAFIAAQPYRMAHQHPNASGFGQCSANFSSPTYSQPLGLASGVCSPEPPIQHLFQNPFTANATNTRSESVRGKRNSPPLSLDIPHGNGQTEDISIDQPESASNADTVTPTVRSFRISMVRSSTNASNRSHAGRSIRRQHESSNSISEDASPSDFATSSTSGSNSSPASDHSEFRCEVCGFTPTGIQAKSGTYLQKHRETHLKRRFPCDYCEKSYSRKDNLANHVKKCPGILAPSSGMDTQRLEGETTIEPVYLPRRSVFYEDLSDFTDQDECEV